MPADWFVALWQRIAVELAQEAQRSDLPPAPPATETEIRDSLRCWWKRRDSPSRTAALDELLDRLNEIKEKA